MNHTPDPNFTSIDGTDFNTTERVGESNSLSKEDRRAAPETSEFYPPLDPQIAPIVLVLRRHGVETFESCQGGSGHAYPEPTVRFHGDTSEGFRALSAAMKERLPVAELRRVWRIQDKEPTGPWWEITFYLRVETSPTETPICNRDGIIAELLAAFHDPSTDEDDRVMTLHTLDEMGVKP